MVSGLGARQSVQGEGVESARLIHTDIMWFLRRNLQLYELFGALSGLGGDIELLLGMCV